MANSYYVVAKCLIFVALGCQILAVSTPAWWKFEVLGLFTEMGLFRTCGEVGNVRSCSDTERTDAMNGVLALLLLSMFGALIALLAPPPNVVTAGSVISFLLSIAAVIVATVEVDAPGSTYGYSFVFFCLSFVLSFFASICGFVAVRKDSRYLRI